MGEASVFEFHLIDDGAVAPTSPGAAARAGSSVATPSPPVESRDREPRSTARNRQSNEDPEKFGKSLLDAIKQAGRYSSLNAFSKAGADLARPILDIGQLIQDIRGRGGKGNQRSVVPELPVAKPLPLPQVFTIEKALFNAEGAQILIHGGQILNAGGGGTPRTPAGGTGNLANNLPALRTPTVPRRVPDIVIPGAGAGAAARAALPALPAASGAAAGVASLGAAAAVAVPPLTAVVVAAGATALALKALYRRSNEQAKALAAYDATLAAAQARAQVANIRQDINSAQYLGKDLAEFTKAQNDLKVAVTQQIDKLEKAFLPIATKTLEILTAYLDGVSKAQEVRDVLREVAKGQTSVLDIFDRLEELEKERKRREESALIKGGDFYSLFESYRDLDIDGDEGELGAMVGRFNVNAQGLGGIGLP